ncbi:AAA family ATPase [Defluviimonas sp. WL0050]|uniref:AAA family ATPase n=1 Tax=Albidovulum litorale TaxID=2984134 RepID=A0ABT2ZN79_9RHOB|nr:AAA family ATPase [Defluviimonas sp. WL0050]MCV2872595.1 AAA family ATPase [Defluviimonas sp. WL0050]
MKTLRETPDMQPPPPPEAYLNEVSEVERKSTFVSAATLHGQDIPKREWHVDGFVPGHNVTLINGDGGTGKSLLALQLAAATAMGKTWLGRFVAGGEALCISAEDDMAEIHRRLADIAAAEGVTLADMDRLTIRSLAGEDALMAHSDGRTGALIASGLYRELEAYMAEAAPALVVLDTLADLFPGNENDRAQARQFIGLLRRLAIRHDCAVVLLAHPSLSGMTSGSGTSGSTAWNNSVRSRLYLERVKSEGYEANPDARVLRGMKSNYARTGGEIALRWQNGVFVAEPQETGLDRLAANSKAERVFLKLLREFAGEGRHLSPKTGHGYAPNVFARSGRAEGCTKNSLQIAMEALFAKGTIRTEESGPPSRRVNRIVESE